MGDSAEQEASHGDMDHGLGDIEALLVVAHETAPACEPGEGSLDHPAAGQNLEAGLSVDTADNLDDEAEEGGLVHELGPVVGTVGEQMLDPWPALADGTEDHLGASAVGEIGRGQIEHQQPSVGIDHDMPLATDRESLLGPSQT